MTDKTTNLYLKAQVDQGLAAQGVKALLDIQAASDAAQKSLLKINDEAAKSSAEFQRLEAVSKTIGRDTAIHDLASQFVDLGTATKDYETQLINLRQSLRDVGATSSEIDKATRAFKELQAEAEGAQGSVDLGGLSKLRGVGRAANQLGLPGAMELQKIGDLGIIIKQLSSASESAGTSILGMTVAFGGLEIALGPLLLVVGAVALAILDLKMVLDLIKKGADEAAAAEKAKFDQQQAQDELDRQNRAAARSTTSAQNKQNAEDNFDDAFKKAQEIADKKAQIAANDKSYNSRGVLDFGGRASDAAAGAELKKELNDLETQQNNFYKTSENATKVLGPAIKATEDQKKATEDLIAASDNRIKQQKEEESLNALTSQAAKQRLDSLKAERPALEAARDALVNSGDTSDAVKAKIDEYNKALADNAFQTKYLTDTSMDLIAAREAEAQKIKDTKEALKEADKAFKDYTDAVAKAGEASAAVAATEQGRKDQLAQEAEDDARQAKRDATEKDYQQRIDAAKQAESIQAIRDKEKQDNDAAEVKAGQSRAKINQDYFEAELKAYSDYIEASKEQTNRADKERLRTLEDAQTDLRKLASEGDVAGFIDRSNAAKTQLKRQQEDANDAQQKLKQDFDKQTAAARAAHEKQLQDLNTSLDQERKARQVAANERIQQIEQSGHNANSRAAQLEQQLNNIREQWRKDDLARQRAAEEKSYQERLAVQIAAQNQALQAEMLYYQNLQNIQNGNPAATTSTASGHSTQVIPQYAGGVSYVPEDRHLAYLDKGERVLTASQNTDYTNGRSGGSSLSVTINNTVGDIATKKMLDEYQDVTIAGIKQAHQQSKGRSHD